MASADTREQLSPIRPFVPHRDLEGLASLIEIAFARELELTGSSIVSELRQMARWNPLLTRSASLLSPFLGFVWIDEGQLVGNVSLTRDSATRIWTMSNVAVLPAFRGRGIASKLVDVAIAYVIRSKASAITLQVRHDNDIARDMYVRRGFCRRRTWYELELALETRLSVRRNAFPEARRTRFGDRKAIRELYKKGPPGQLGAPFPFSARIAFMLEGHRLVERCVSKRGRLVAYGVVRPRANEGANQAEIRVLPEARGLVEQALLTRLLSEAQQRYARVLHMLIPSSSREALEAARLVGMRQLRLLDEMELRLNEGEAMVS